MLPWFNRFHFIPLKEGDAIIARNQKEILSVARTSVGVNQAQPDEITPKLYRTIDVIGGEGRTVNTIEFKFHDSPFIAVPILERMPHSKINCLQLLSQRYILDLL